MISTFFLRNLAAVLTLTLGLCLVAQLWFSSLNLFSIIAALTGFIYLITAVGLFGRSRFTLAFACVLPLAGSWMQLNWLPDDHSNLALARVTGDAVIVLCSAVVLWRLRHQPSQ